jgi:hypothetical protein
MNNGASHIGKLESRGPVYYDVTGLFVCEGQKMRGQNGDEQPREGGKQMDIHLVEPLNHFVKVKDNVWESGSWRLDESEAKKLVGGEIYFHKKRQEPSFYGGTILGYRVNQDGEYPGRIVFILQHSQSCRNVRTEKSGWIKDVKISARES